MQAFVLNTRRSYEEIVNNYEVTFVAGGGAQNVARGAAVCVSTFL